MATKTDPRPDALPDDNQDDFDVDAWNKKYYGDPGEEDGASTPSAPQDPRKRQPAPPTAEDFRSNDPAPPPPPRAEDRRPPPPPSAGDFRSDAPAPPSAKDRSDVQGDAPDLGSMESGASVGGGQKSDRDPNESRFSRALNNSDTVQGIKNKADTAEKYGQMLGNAARNAKKGKQAGEMAGKAAAAGAKAGVTAGKTGAQAAGTASGAATAGVGTLVTAAEMAAEAAAKKLNKMRKGDFSVSKKTIFAVLVPVIFAGVFIIGLIMLPKFAAKTFTSTVRTKLMDRVDYTLEKRANLYIADYAQDVLLPNLQQCGRVTNTTCYAGEPGPTERHQRLYEAWQKGKIEEKIALRYDFTFQAGASDNYQDIVVLKDGKPTLTYENYYASGLALKHIMGVTEASGVQQRWLVRHTVNSRFGGKWCIMLCADADALVNESMDLLSKMKLKVSSRVISKSAARISTLLSCGPSCTPEILASTAQAAAKKALEVADSKFLLEIFEELGPLKLVEFLATKVLENLLSAQGVVRAAKFAFNLPVTAWHTVTSVINGSLGFVHNLLATKELNEFTAEKNMSEFVDAGSSMDSSVDEVATGKAPIRQQGAVFRYLRNAPRDRMVQKIRNISPKSAITCDDGTILQGEDDPMTCVDKHVIRDIDVAAVSSNPYFSFFSSAFDAIAGALDFLPGINVVLRTAVDWKNNVGQSLGFIVEEEVPPVFTQDPGGEPIVGTVFSGHLMAEDFIYMIGSDDVDGGRIGMAGKVLNAGAQASLDLAIAKENEKKLGNQSLFARYLDPDNPTSLFSSTMLDFATSMPMLIDEPMRFHFNPFSIIGNLGMALGFSQKASAQGAVSLGDRSQYMRIPSIGYTDDELNTDPKTLDAQTCSDLYEEREASFADQGDGIKLPTKSDICQADEMTILTLTAFTKLMPRAALDDYNTSPVATTGPVRSEACESVPEKFLIFRNGAEGEIYACKVKGFTVNVEIASNFSNMMTKAIQDNMNFGGWALRPHERQHTLRTEHGCGGDGSGRHSPNEDPSKWVRASACSPPTAKPGQSQHEIGLAIDFTYNGRGITSRSNPGFQWLAANAGQFGFQNLPSEPWHWSTTGK